MIFKTQAKPALPNETKANISVRENWKEGIWSLNDYYYY